MEMLEEMSRTEVNRESRFDRMARTWDLDPERLARARTVGRLASELTPLELRQDALDYGTGTGAVALELARSFGRVVAADSSDGMLEVLKEKIQEQRAVNVTPLKLDLENEPAPGRSFHLITSNMALHHVADVDKVVSTLASMLHPNGLLCVVDLDEEDGAFHSDTEGIHHFGFSPEQMSRKFAAAGLKNISTRTLLCISKETKPGVVVEYAVVMTLGRKPEQQPSMSI